MIVKHMKEELDRISDGDDFAEIVLVDEVGQEFDLTGIELVKKEGLPTKLVFKTDIPAVF